MCGIICILSGTTENSVNTVNIFQVFKENIANRGPDSLNVEKYSSENWDLLFAASVLWLQGKCITSQPLKDDESLFVYNGDIFGGISDHHLMRADHGDTTILFDAIKQMPMISAVLASKQGPYAFIYLDKRKQKLYFARDIFGRRSLLIGKRDDSLILTSVAKRNSGYDFMELPSIGIFCLDLSLNQIIIIPWQYQNLNFESKLLQLKNFLNKEIDINQEFVLKAGLRFVEPNSNQLDVLNKIENYKGEVFDLLIRDEQWSRRILKLKELLINAVHERISSQPKFCKNCVKEKLECNHSLVGVLFSGGVDCAVLALLAGKLLGDNRSIDLINVSFDEANQYKSPDRITGLETLEELKTIYPDRKWNFLEVNVTQEELDKARQERIADLIYPLQSILDDSLGCALWFASRAKQTTSNGEIVSPCRVLLVGMGADELFGGYTRHRAAFKKHSWQGLHDMLNEDWQNLSHRNLGRDDRVVADHGRQLRTPYLDENVVNFVRSLNCWEKTFPSDQLPHGVGDKILLRMLAYDFGLKNAAMLKKRALQFGSRIANRKENAHEISSRLCS